MEEPDFISDYMQLARGGEVPEVFTRWSCISLIGTLLGRQFWLNHGNNEILPNTYLMLIGSAGTRKSTAIKTAKSLIKQTGFTDISADRTTKEKFFLDLAGLEKSGPGSADVDDILEQNIFGTSDLSSSYKQMYIAADEFNEFIGPGASDFIPILGSLWDYKGLYENRIKNGQSVAIPNPTINILGGNTPTSFSNLFTTDIFGQGFFSRLLLIYGEPNGRRITFPEPTPPERIAALIERLGQIKSKVFGPAVLTNQSRILLDRIYQGNQQPPDVRFAAYTNRRLTHLFKICLIIAASRGSTEISERDVIKANTILHHAEQFMPKALGEFGRAKNAEVTHKVVELINNSESVLGIYDIWEHVSQDLEKITDLVTLMQNLIAAKKVQTVKGDKGGYLPLRKMIDEPEDGLVDYSLLTAEEQNMRK